LIHFFASCAGWEVASESESDSDGEWVAVSHSDDEGDDNADVTEEQQEQEPEDVVERAKAVSMTRLLTPADFAAIKKARALEAMEAGGRGNKNKRKAASTHNMEEGAGASMDGAVSVSVDEIERLHKKMKMDREQRIAALQANKQDKEKWLSKKQMRKQAREIGTTNTDKKKSKKCVLIESLVLTVLNSSHLIAPHLYSFVMVQHGKSVRRKNLLSQLEKSTRARSQKRKEKMRRR
jgi:hypothetical protein